MSRNETIGYYGATTRPENVLPQVAVRRMQGIRDLGAALALVKGLRRDREVCPDEAERALLDLRAETLAVLAAIDGR
jgi:hypothetical protein